MEKRYRFSEDSTYRDLYEKSPLKEYAKHLAPYAGSDNPSYNLPISKAGCATFPFASMVDSLNDLVECEEKGELVYSELSDTVSFLGQVHKERKKVAIVLAGGGYNAVCTLVEATPFANYLYKEGFSSFTVTYGVGPNAKAPRPLDDLASFVRYLFVHEEELNIDMDGYSVTGFSAAGHLVALFGSERVGYAHYGLKKPLLLGLCYPVISMDPLITHKGSSNAFLGPNPSKEDILLYSADRLVTKEYPATYLWQCEKDYEVPFKNSELMDRALIDHSVPHIYRHYDASAHSWGIAKGTLANDWPTEFVSFYKSLSE